MNISPLQQTHTGPDRPEAAPPAGLFLERASARPPQRLSALRRKPPVFELRDGSPGMSAVWTGDRCLPGGRRARPISRFYSGTYRRPGHAAAGTERASAFLGAYGNMGTGHAAVDLGLVAPDQGGRNRSAMGTSDEKLRSRRGIPGLLLSVLLIAGCTADPTSLAAQPPGPQVGEQVFAVGYGRIAEIYLNPVDMGKSRPTACAAWPGWTSPSQSTRRPARSGSPATAAPDREIHGSSADDAGGWAAVTAQAIDAPACPPRRFVRHRRKTSTRPSSTPSWPTWTPIRATPAPSAPATSGSA